MLMLTRANLLVLDEPTNHLDVETIEVLEDAIESYEGSVILVSHDRAMLRALANKVWVLHGRHITTFDGIPTTIKDTTNVKGWPTRYGSHSTDETPASDNAAPTTSGERNP